MSDNTRLKFKPERLWTAEEAAAFDIVKSLQDKGYEAYWAGGAVRDMILGLPVHDIDIATSAKPEEVKNLFPKSYDRGKAFGVVAVRKDDHEFEVATFRADLGIADHRRPATVEFTSAEEDAKRRDFTINGIFYDPIGEEIIDYVQGLAGIKRKVIQFIGSPQERIDEDYLRILRAVRFFARLDFQIEPETLKAIKKNAGRAREVSAERVREELSKMLLLENRANTIELMDELGILNKILPELETIKNVNQPPEFHTEGDVWTHTMLALKNIGETNNEELVWCILLHDIAKPQTIGFRSEKNKTSITFFEHDIQSAEKAEEILGRFKFSSHFIESVTWAIRQHMRIVHAFRGMSERKQQRLFCDKNIDLLLNLTKADLSASLRPDGKPDMQLYKDALVLREKFEMEASEEERRQARKFDLVTGQDIIDILKISAGPKVGQIKTEIEQAYLEGEINNREDALKMLEKYRHD